MDDNNLPPQDSTNPSDVGKGESPPLQPGAAGATAKETIVAFERFLKTEKGKGKESDEQSGSSGPHAGAAAETDEEAERRKNEEQAKAARAAAWARVEALNKKHFVINKLVASA